MNFENLPADNVSNLVMFPASKNFPELDSSDDPLEDLLNEFGSIQESELPMLDDEQEKLDVRNSQSFKSALDQYILIQDQMKLLSDSVGRMRVYLDEIETRLS